jgi:hypothetical protein
MPCEGAQKPAMRYPPRSLRGHALAIAPHKGSGCGFAEKPTCADLNELNIMNIVFTPELILMARILRPARRESAKHWAGPNSWPASVNLV